jgi:hypothetical protein
MTKQIVMEFSARIIKQYPSLYNDIIDFIRLAAHGIEYGASPTHEWELAYKSIEELISKHKNKQQNESID